MSKPIQRRSYKNKDRRNNCEYCSDYEYLGEGDFACMKYQNPVLVKTEWTPTEYYNRCKKCRDYIPETKEK